MTKAQNWIRMIGIDNGWYNEKRNIGLHMYDNLQIGEKRPAAYFLDIIKPNRIIPKKFKTRYQTIRFASKYMREHD